MWSKKFRINIEATLLKKESLAQVFSCEFCEISKIAFFYRTSPVAAENLKLVKILLPNESVNPEGQRE